MRPLLLAVVLSAIASSASAMTCEEALSRVDTFGRLRWKDPVSAPPAWAVEVDCAADCEFSDPEGTRYALGDGFMLDKEIKAGAGTHWPWGLESGDGPGEAKVKLARLLPGALAKSPDDPSVYYLNIEACMAWLEIAFDGERGIKAVSLNAQP